MPTYQTVLYESRNNIAWITLNRPDVLNALNEQLTTDLHAALKEAEKDSRVRCLVISGAGRGFCSGQDLRSQSDSEPRSLKDSLVRRYNPIIRRIRSMEKPVVAMINGVAAGAGCSLALACDMRIMSEGASLIEVFIRIGLVPDSGSHWFLVRSVGLAKAFELAALGDAVDASAAMELGLVNRVVAADSLAEETAHLAGRLASAPTKAIGLIKRALNKATHSDLETVLGYEAYLQEIASRTDDHKEGVRAFIEKRKPDYKGT
jgi:2-(1,2-epoxy-1,2-dihydrophenyl)acetyl-CoA isomerase